MSLQRRMSRLPLRVRLVAGFSLASFIVLTAAGAFVYWRVERALDHALDTELVHATSTLTGLIDANGHTTDRAQAEATGVAWQVLTPAGKVLDHSAAAGPKSLIRASQLTKVTTTPHVFDVGHLVPISKRPFHVQVVEVSTAPKHYLLTAVRRDHNDEALRELLGQLALAGFGALVITALVGDRLARAALQPVERYRRQAASIAEGNTTMRLDVPGERDDEITRLGHTFNDMLSTLEGALHRERQFVAEASHELRTPITLLTSRIQLALRRSRTAEEHERILEELKVDLDRLAGLTDQLLRLGRMDATHRNGSSDLVAITRRTVDQRRMAEPSRATELVVDLPDEAIEVPLADYEVERIITNFLDNARVHGRPPVTVNVDEPGAGWVRLVVTDAGNGMSPTLLSTATQRFTRAEESRTSPGSGLGLSLVDGLVSGVGGELRLCHRGRHASHGSTAPIPCDHGPEMTVTVLLPGAYA